MYSPKKQYHQNDSMYCSKQYQNDNLTYSSKQYDQNGSYPHHHHHHHHHHQQYCSPPIMPPPSIGPWSTGLCDCCDDYNSCCLTLWCPCITFGRIAEVVDGGSVSCRLNGYLYSMLSVVLGCSCCYTSIYRTKLRQQYLLEGETCNDCCTHILCERCALCQEYRELENRGYVLSHGWEGNVERQRGMTMTQPAVQWGMIR